MSRISFIRTKGVIAFVALILLISCKVSISEGNHGLSGKNASHISAREYSIAAVLWQQRSSEYRALAYQAFNIAKMQLDDYLANNEKSLKPLAIITDIDETILDNSPYSGKQIELDEDYITTRWDEWVNLKSAKAIPGSLEFFKYAESKGVETFYITNRDEHQKKVTLENLKTLGFPNADENHILLRRNDSEKETRRD
ncbi:MAG TPA: HAD family acid phosphatase, partial [Aequorivita sp.]|nr:HAD family acid phosphatase [Aequorivita sp.]